MTYANPLPEGMTEPDETAVRLSALETLIRHIVMGWPEDRIEATAKYYAGRGVGPGCTYVDETYLVRARGDEVASEILRDVWLSIQATAERQMMKDGTHPLSPPEPGDV